MRFMQTESVLQTKNRSGPAKNRFSVALLYSIRTFKSISKQTVIVDGQTSYQLEKHKMYPKLLFITFPSRSVSFLTSH